MPKLSAFTPCGSLKCSGAPSRVEIIYRALCSLAGGYDLTVGTHEEAVVYARARGLAAARNALERAGNQGNAAKAYDLLPLREQDFLVTPGPRDTVPQRQAALKAKRLMSRGARVENVVAGLRAILGAKFLSYMPSPAGLGGTPYPTDPTTGPANFVDARRAAKVMRLIDPAAGPINGVASIWVAYESLDAVATPLLKGDVVVVGGENSATAERVTVLDESPGPTVASLTTPGYRCFQAVLSKPHDVGATVTTGDFPHWWSTQRHSLVIVTAAAAVDTETRRKVDEFMRGVSRGVSTWAIVEPSAIAGIGGTVGPLTVNSPMGCVPLGTFTFTNSP